jgi:hypothetical protein
MKEVSALRSEVIGCGIVADNCFDKQLILDVFFGSVAGSEHVPETQGDHHWTREFTSAPSRRDA